MWKTHMDRAQSRTIDWRPSRKRSSKISSVPADNDLSSDRPGRNLLEDILLTVQLINEYCVDVHTPQFLTRNWE